MTTFCLYMRVFKLIPRVHKKTLLIFAATRYGKGCYFAVNSSYSVRYSSQQKGVDTKCMFLARVLTGDFCVGNQSMKAPPEKPNSGETPRKYDSTVNDAINPTIFVVYNDASVYPEYLITFT